ncbi:MAG: extracellular solute-binding protein [Pseudomonadota bacterium]
MTTTRQLSRTIDRIAGGNAVGRRDVMQAMAVLGLGVAAMPLAPRTAGAQDLIAYFTWSGYEVRELHPGFIETYGEDTVAATFFGSEEEALLKMQRDYRADVAHPCSYSLPHWIDAGVAGPIDVTRLSNWPDLFPQLRELPDTIRDGEHYLVPFDWGTSSVLYRSDLVDPKYIDDPSWGILFDEAYAGRLAMYDTAVMVDIAMLVNGHDDLSAFTDAQLDEVRPLLEKGNSLFRFYWTDPTEVTRDLATGDLVAAYAWNGMTKPLVEQGVPVTYMNPKEGQFAWVCGLTIDPRSQADPAMVYDFIDAMISPEAGVYEIEVYDYGHANMKAFELASTEALTRLGITDPGAVFERGHVIPALPADLEAKINALADEVKGGL